MMIGKILENIRVAWVALMSNKLRAALTILGITIGIASVVTLVSIGQALDRYIVDYFNQFGSNLVFVIGAENRDLEGRAPGPPDEMANPADMLIPLTREDARAIADLSRVPDALFVSSTLMVTGDVTYEDRRVDMPQIAGTDTEYFDAIDLEIEYGRGFTQEDLDGARRVAILGVNVVEDLFPNGGLILGKSIRVKDVRFEVIGILEEIPGGDAAEADNTSVVIPITTAQQRLASERTRDGKYPVTTILIQARDESRVQAVVDQVRLTLRETHSLESDDDDDFSIMSYNQILDSLSTITQMLTYFLAAVAGISLLVGGIGIMNIMLVTVTERTSEIGLRKAVGAHKIDILIQFLTESITLALLGGAVGTGLSITSAILATEFIPDLEVAVGAPSIVLATLISVAIGAFFGVYPANRAASLNPIDALRHE